VWNAGVATGRRALYGEVVLSPRVHEVAVRFTVDGEDYAADVFSDESALRAVRALIGTERLGRQCEQGLCGTCECVVDGQRTRLCLVPAPLLDGRTIETAQPT
jgi:aerobic-type carbon monoxide dehydrogenase small subunit (CoxS/CutS family)